MTNALYCDDCAEVRLWPVQTSQLIGLCQFCNQFKMCSEIHAGVLPEPTTLELCLGKVTSDRDSKRPIYK